MQNRSAITRSLATATVLAALALTSLGVSAHGDGDGHGHGAASQTTYDAKSTGTRDLVLGPVTIRMLAEASNLGTDGIEVGELNLPPDYGEGVAHAHGSLEIFYVVSGVLGHEVNGRAHTLHPGEIGFVRPGDEVRHSVLSDSAVKAVVIWVPGGEADKLVEHAGFMTRPPATR